MKILFIYKYEAIEPLGIMYLSGFLKQHGHKCAFIDIQFEKEIDKEIAKIKPDIIAYSITTGKHKLFLRVNKQLKKKFSFFSLFGGPHCTFFPEFVYEDSVDAICRGEGELAILELADNLEKGKEITRIKNLWVKINRKVYENEQRGLIEDLDSLPFPDRELVDNYPRYRRLKRRVVLTGRGCPYNCTYCFNHSYHKLYQNKGRIIRERSVHNVLEELKSIKHNYKVNRFQFIDDTFILNKKWTLDICARIKNEVNVPFIVNVRPNLVDEEIIKALKAAGCKLGIYAIESGNDYIRNHVLKRGMSEKQIIGACILFRKYGIKSFSQNMVGLPDETLEMAFETLELNKKCKPTYAWMSIFQPYPRTELYHYSIKKGYFNNDLNLFKDSYHEKSVMKMRDIEKMERLHHLFSLVVALPSLRPLVRLLIRLPFDKFYFFLYKIHKYWHYTTKDRFI